MGEIGRGILFVALALMAVIAAVADVPVSCRAGIPPMLSVFGVECPKALNNMEKRDG